VDNVDRDVELEGDEAAVEALRGLSTSVSPTEALEYLHRKYRPRIRNFILSLCQDIELAEDLTQICWVRVWRRRESLKREEFSGSFRKYLFTTARRLVIDESRRRGRHPVVPIEGLMRDSDGSPTGWEPQSEDAESAYQTLNEEEKYEQLRTCLQRLAERARKVVELKLQGENARDINDILGLARKNVNDVNVMYYRAFIQLQKCMSAKPGGPNDDGRRA